MSSTNRKAGSPAETRLRAGSELAIVAGPLDSEARCRTQGPGGLELRVDDAIPGEAIQVRVDKLSRGAPVAWARRIDGAGEDRRDPPCALHGRCGGCGLQHIRDERQLELKVQSGLKLLPEALADTLAAPDSWIRSEPFGYRHKAVLIPSTSTGELRLGGYKRGSHDVIDLRDCGVVSPAIARAHASIQVALEPAIAAGRPVRGPGLPLRSGEPALRAVVLRANRAGEVLATAVVRTEAAVAWVEEALRTQVGWDVTGLFVQVFDGPGDAVTGREAPRHLAGVETLRERVAEVELSLRPLAFFQVNPAVLDGMVGALRELLSDRLPQPGTDQRLRLLDLYCGGGALGLALAGEGVDVLGVERDGEAVASARADAERCGVQARFEAGLVADAKGEFDVVLVDPPRAGLKGARVAGLAPTIVYVSCSSASLAKDAARLMDSGYRPTALIPADMLAQTPHLEWVARFDRD